MVPGAYRMALVTSSLTINSVVNMRSESPQLVSWRSARVRAVATIAGSLGKVQEATWSSRSTEVRASRRTTFSAARQDNCA
jgi:hypothetical protein